MRALLLSLMLLAACGEAPAPDAKASTKTTKAAAAAETKPRRDGIPPARCPAPASAGEGLDIRGIRLGEPALTALDRLRCAHPDALLFSEERWVAGLNSYGEKLGPQLLRLRIGPSQECRFGSVLDSERCDDGRVWEQQHERYLIATPGLPGQQRVGAIWYWQRYADGPLLAQAEQALIDKFGPPQQRLIYPTVLQLRWARDLQGRPEALEGNPCPGLVATGVGRWQEGCGLRISADLQRRRDNADLVSEVHLAGLHQQGLHEQVQALEAGLRERDAQRRAQQNRAAAGQAPSF